MKPLRLAAIAFAAVALVASTGRAQTVDVPILSREAVGQALAAAEAEAKKNGWAVSIAVMDPWGVLLGFVRLDNAPLSSIDIAMGKARTAAKFRRPSKAIEDLVTTRVAFVAVDGLTPVEGGVPIIVNDKVVGSIGVSGVTSQQDAQVARAGADRVGTPPR